ncbi:MAG: mevalonate kinase [Anaerolineae bacterium]|nr:mevalonate kinase [Anaerolineae bacterium]
MEASAPAKVILFGEHAVVYGQPAIAVPVSSLRATATARPGDHTGLRIVASNLNQTTVIDSLSQSIDDALALTARLLLQRLDAPIPNLEITLRSQIPVASGLGSGAAITTALARALVEALDAKLDTAELNAIVYEVEKLHHGTPSGIDNTVIVYEQPVYFIRGNPIEHIHIAEPFTLLIADTGKPGLTRIAVGDVRTLYESQRERIQPMLDDIGNIVRRARQSIETGSIEQLGPLMSRNHALLQELTVSSPELDVLVQAALKAGAAGAKMSGGGRGGNMIALVSPESAETVSSALRSAGAVRVIETRVAPLPND